MFDNFSSHYYRYRQQYKAKSHAKKNLDEHEMLLHTDFFENYSEKYAMEPQISISDTEIKLLFTNVLPTQK
jgi:hypothetical protein